MKKFALFIFTAAIMISCKEKTNDDTVVIDNVDTADTVNSVICDTNDPVMIEFNDMVNDPNTDYKDILDWLKNKGEPFCKGDLISCLGSFHKIDQADYNTARTAHANGAAEYKKTWPEIKNELEGIECWEKHLVISIEQDRISFERKPFDTATVAYSKPFFLSLEEDLDLDNNDTLYFSKAVTPRGNVSKDDIIFRVEVYNPNNQLSNTQYYDISENPTLMFEGKLKNKK